MLFGTSPSSTVSKFLIKYFLHLLEYIFRPSGATSHNPVHTVSTFFFHMCFFLMKIKL